MATIENRSKYQVTVKNRPDLTLKFPFNRLADVKAHMAAVRAQGLKSRVEQEEDQVLVRIRRKGYPPLQDSGPAGEQLLQAYRSSLRAAGKPVRKAKFQMRETCSELQWIHKRFTEVLTTDIEDFMEERLQSVAPATLDRELDILRSVVTVATKGLGLQPRQESNGRGAASKVLQ